jgi:histidinol phosphatase-like enzyme
MRKKDIKTAKRFGCKSVLIDRWKRNADFGQDYTVMDLNGLCEVL